MKITKSKDDIEKALARQTVANIGCDKCPCCGEAKPFYSKVGIFYGISHLAPRVHIVVRNGKVNHTKIKINEGEI